MLFFSPNGARCADKLVKNGDFEKGRAGWVGDGRIVKLEDGNRVWEIRADKRRLRIVSQPIEVEEGAPSVTLKFRARALPGYQGRGLNLDVQVGRISTSQDFALVGDGAWHDFQAIFARAQQKQHQLNFTVQIGAGEIQLDDIMSVMPNATAPPATLPNGVQPPTSSNGPPSTVIKIQTGH